MNDDLHPSDTPSDDLLAVNAVIDGTATAADLATVEASNELRALVEQLRNHQRALAEVPVPPAARERAIAAALGGFDELHAAPAAVASPPNVHSLDRRRHQYRMLVGAAAAVAVLFVGAAALSSTMSSNDESSTAVEAPSTKSSSAAAADAQTAEAATAMEAPADDATAAPEATDAATDAPTDIEVASTIGAIPGAGSVDNIPTLADEGALRTFADGRVPIADTAGGGFSCVDDPTSEASSVLGQVIYDGRDAIIVRDDASGIITALDLIDCSVLVAVAP